MRHLTLLLALLFAVNPSQASDDAVYTLYRTSVVEGVGRIHIATFDSKDGEAYNRENCEIAAQLFQAQPGVKTRYFCEKGRYRP